MAGSTGLAVGLAIGIPTLIGVIVALFFWHRGRARLQRELDYEDERHKDINFDEISFNPENSEAQAGAGLQHHRRSGLPKTASDVSIGDDTEDQDQQGSSSTTAGAPTISKTRKSSQNYLDYYDTVIPVLPAHPDASVSSSPHRTSPRPDQGSGSPQQQQQQGNFLRRLTQSHRRHQQQDPQQDAQQDHHTSPFDVRDDQLPVPGIQLAPAHFKSDSHSSISTDYIKQLNRNDSASYPITSYTLANVSNHAVNVYNNYNSSRSGSGLNLYESKSPSVHSEVRKSASAANLVAGQKAEAQAETQAQAEAAPGLIQGQIRVRKSQMMDDGVAGAAGAANAAVTRHGGIPFDADSTNDTTNDNSSSTANDSGIIHDDGYTNYDSNKRTFLTSLRP